MKVLYNCVHYNAVLKENSVTLANNAAKVMEGIEVYLENPTYLQKERKNTVNKLCYKIDGLASKRMANVVFDVLNV